MKKILFFHPVGKTPYMNFLEKVFEFCSVEMLHNIVNKQVEIENYLTAINPSNELKRRDGKAIVTPSFYTVSYEHQFDLRPHQDFCQCGMISTTKYDPFCSAQCYFIAHDIKEVEP
jgi:hypothetical protein